MRRATAAVVLSLGLACSAGVGGWGERSADASVSHGFSEPSPGLTHAERPRAQDWRGLAASERWPDAAAAIDALPDSERKEPGTRLARARAAMQLADFTTARDQLHELEKALPELAPFIQRLRAESQREVGPFDEAARYYQQQTSVDAWLKSARAWQRAGQTDDASRQLTRAFKKIRRSKRLKAEARMLRAELREAGGETSRAAADYRWLATEAPEYGIKVDAASKLAKLSPKQALTKKERQTRARFWADRGSVARAEAELKELAKAKGKKVFQYEVDFIRGWALYSARRYAEAAEKLDTLSKKATPHRERAKFYTARALSRIHQDDEAAKRYASLAKQHPKSSYASRALYLAARLRYIGGDWEAAIRGYEAYLKDYPRSGNAGGARYEVAVSYLAIGQYGKAARAFEKLKARDSKRRTWLSQLEGVARLGAGEKTRAKELFRDAIKSAPLSFAALASSSRLRAMGEDVDIPALLGSPATDGADGADATDGAVARSDAAHGAVARSDATPAIRLPADVERLASFGLFSDAEARLHDQASSIRAAHGADGGRALCDAFGALNRGRERYRVGIGEVRSATLGITASADTRWAWECTHPRPFPAVVAEAVTRWKLTEPLIYGLMRQESGYRARVVSPAGAVGLMQIMPGTGRKIADELSLSFDVSHLQHPPRNVDFGAYYLRKLLDMFGSNVPVALAAYNAGPAVVGRWLESGKELPLDVWVARIPYRETRNYVAKVVRNQARYAYLAGGLEAIPELPMQLPAPNNASEKAY